MAIHQTLEIPTKGMDCAECTQHVQRAISKLDGVQSVDVLLATEKAIIILDPNKVDLPAIRKAVASAGDYSVPEIVEQKPVITQADFNRKFNLLLAGVFGGVLFIVIAGEFLGLFDALNALIPLPIGAAIVVVVGFPIYRNVIRATLNRQVISHTLMTIGVIAALVIGDWVTAPPGVDRRGLPACAARTHGRGEGSALHFGQEPRQRHGLRRGD